MKPGVLVLSRTWCHLCDELVAALEPVAAEFGAEVHVVDVDEHPELEARWNELVPVVLVEGDYVCHYRLDEAVLRAKLSAFPVRSGS